MKKREFLRNITIGLTDGTTLPFALVAGLSNAVKSGPPIAAAGIALAAAGALTMGIGSYMEQGERAGKSGRMAAPLTIAVSYLLGGLLASLPFLLVDEPQQALPYSILISLLLLLFAGYYESRVNNVNGWTGAVRVMLTGAAAALAAFYVAKLFV